ncbi:hypothetical protein EI94DRAFT_1815076 [Lactarius quietus]|nr:hypothetical protein EI94DRAFT_1815076 [Lactarius quietus]
MESVQSTIRAAIKLGTFPAPVEAEGFGAFAIASNMGLVPEMEDAARLTLGKQVTFESLGEGLRSFNGRALVRISNPVIRAFWDALTVVAHKEIEKAELTLVLIKEEPTSEKLDPPLAPLSLNVPDANILRSSDQVNFRAHKSVLAMSSPFFEDLLSLPQPPEGELEDGLPVIQLSEDAGLLNILVPLLYPTSTMIRSSYEKVFALLAACQKYDMESIQSNIRAEIKRRGSLTPLGSDAFRPFALASRLTLIPEMDSAARLTLGYPMTFESLGEGLGSFSGWALCDLVRYRKRCRDNIVSCLDSFFDVHSRCQIWEGCKERHWDTPQTVPIGWLRSFFTSKTAELGNGFTCELSSPSYILEGYTEASKTTRTHVASVIPVFVCM